MCLCESLKRRGSSTWGRERGRIRTQTRRGGLGGKEGWKQQEEEQGGQCVELVLINESAKQKQKKLEK